MDFEDDYDELESIIAPQASRTTNISTRHRRNTNISHHDPSEFIEPQRPLREFEGFNVSISGSFQNIKSVANAGVRSEGDASARRASFVLEDVLGYFDNPFRALKQSRLPITNVEKSLPSDCIRPWKSAGNAADEDGECKPPFLPSNGRDVTSMGVGAAHLKKKSFSRRTSAMNAKAGTSKVSTSEYFTEAGTGTSSLNGFIANTDILADDIVVIPAGHESKGDSAVTHPAVCATGSLSLHDHLIGDVPMTSSYANSEINRVSSKKSSDCVSKPVTSDMITTDVSIGADSIAEVRVSTKADDWLKADESTKTYLSVATDQADSIIKLVQSTTPDLSPIAGPSSETVFSTKADFSTKTDMLLKHKCHESSLRIDPSSDGDSPTSVNQGTSLELKGGVDCALETAKPCIETAINGCISETSKQSFGGLSREVSTSMESLGEFESPENDAFNDDHNSSWDASENRYDDDVFWT